MLVGLFEPVGAPWSLDGVPREFAFGKLPPDWERMEPYLGQALDRIPSLSEVGIRTLFCGPESFTSDVRPLLGPAPELDGYFVAAGLNSLGILSGGGVGNMLAHWIVDGVPPVDATAVAIDRTAAYETSRRFRAERTVEQLGVLFGDAVWPAWKPSTGRDVRRSVLHERLAAAGGHFGASAGWEFAEWFAGPGEAPAAALDYRRQDSHAIVAREHAAVREAVGVLDMSLMAKLMVQGPDAATVLSRLSARPDEATMARGRAELQRAAAPAAKTARERAYIAALGRFYAPGTLDYQARVDAYSAAMGSSTGAIRTMSTQQRSTRCRCWRPRRPMTPASRRIARRSRCSIPWCNTPTIRESCTTSFTPATRHRLRSEGLVAARHYGEIAASAPMRCTCPVTSLRGSACGRRTSTPILPRWRPRGRARGRNQSDGMDQFHSDDFLLYAYLQSGQDERAKRVIEDTAALLTHTRARRRVAGAAFHARDDAVLSQQISRVLRVWKCAIGNPRPRWNRSPARVPTTQTLTYWARIVALGHLREAARARADLAAYQSLTEQVRSGKHAYLAESTSARDRAGRGVGLDRVCAKGMRPER